MEDLPELPHEINDPQPYLPGIAVPWWIWVLAALVVLALLGLLLFLLTRPKPATPPPLPQVYEECKRRLEALRHSLDGRSLAAVATEASLTLRSYLSQCLSEPALYETHEETLLRADALSTLPQGSRDRLSPLLVTLAEYKYGPSRVDETLAEKLIKDCLETLQGLESTRPRSIA